jgi:hypothetical protein
VSDDDLKYYVPLKECPALTGMPITTCYRTAKRLGVVKEFLGLKFVHKRHIRKLKAAHMSVGNPIWIRSGEEAARQTRRAIASRLERIKRVGMTEAEKARNERLKTLRKS